MKSNQIIKGWKRRCLELDKPITQVFREAGVSPSVSSQWGRSKSECPEADVVEYLERNGVAFNLVANAVESVKEYPNRNRIFLTYIRVERHLRELEAVAVAANAAN